MTADKREPTDVMKEITEYVKAGHRQMCRVGQGDYPHKERKPEVCVPGHAIIDALRDITLRLVETKGHAQNCRCFGEHTRLEGKGGEVVKVVIPSYVDPRCGARERLNEENARLKAEVERLETNISHLMGGKEIG